MRCGCCNKRLSDYETTLKHAETGEYLDLCMDCLSDIAQEVPMPVKSRREFLEQMLCEKDLIESMDTNDVLDNIDDLGYNKYLEDKEDKDNY